jgi:hypothetical protein
VEYVKPTYYENEFKEMFRKWVEEKGLTYDWDNYHLYNNTPTLYDFKTEITAAYYREMLGYLREIGVKIPFTGTNMHPTGYGLTKANAEMDYSDNHLYFYDWRWGNTERICQNRAITSAATTWQGYGHLMIANQPYFVSEWDVPWPNSFRAESPIYYAAVGALQGWSGFAIHTYSYARRLERDSILGSELSSPVAGVPYREGIFSTWNDPAKFGLFYHAALITRRGDVSPAVKKIAVPCENFAMLDCTAFDSGLERHRMASVVTAELPQGYDELSPENQPVADAEGRKLVADNGQMWRNPAKRVGVVDTERTKAVYGRIGPVGHNSTKKKVGVSVELNGMKVEGDTDFGVIALSSLTDDPIETSENMLLSAIGRARNSGAQFDGPKMLEIGHTPIMAEVVNAKISLKTAIGDKLKVWGVNAEGFYSGCLPTDYENGILSFEIGDDLDPACYYLIVKE